MASEIATVIKDNKLYNCVLNRTNGSITLYSNQELAALSDAPTNCTVSSVKHSDKVFQPSLEATFREELQKLNSEQRQAAQELLEKYSRVCAGKMDFRRCDLHKLQSNLEKDTQPSVVAYRAMKATKLNDPEEFIDKLLPKDLIDLTHLEREAPTFLIPNKDSKFRFSKDYRIMKAQTLKISWPLPRVQDVL